jgi:predicted amidohydrolase YtcJ
MLAHARVALLLVIPAAALTIAARSQVEPADIILLHGRVHSLRWAEPALDGTPARGAPHDASGWHPDAQAIAIRGGTIAWVGDNRGITAYRGPNTRVIDIAGKTAVPGLIDAHVHLAELGANLSRVDLSAVATEEEAVDRVAARARSTPKGEWIIGSGWDEGAWANHYPTMALLTQRVPDHPVYLRGLHGYAAWGNRLAFERAGITAATAAPAGGEILKDGSGQPTGIVLNGAVSLLARALPPRTQDRLEGDLHAALDAMVKAGYVSVHEAGADSTELAALQALDRRHELPIRVYVMLAASDTALCRRWLARGPDTTSSDMLIVRAVKAFADGALGSRGARLIADYSDQPGQRGITGGAYRYDSALVAAMMRRGFQVAIHAIGDAANRETIDFISSVVASSPVAAKARPRIEHAQVLSPADIPRFARAGIIASMQPSHAVEDMAWAEARLGPERIRGAYAWRTLRKAGARLVFSSDLPATDYDIFYGLHSAITRQGRDGAPPGGWHAEQAMTPEEALRAFTSWAAYAEFSERKSGVLAPGMRADITVMDTDPLVASTSASDPAGLLKGKISFVIAAGRVITPSRR